MGQQPGIVAEEERYLFNAKSDILLGCCLIDNIQLGEKNNRELILIK